MAHRCPHCQQPSLSYYKLLTSSRNELVDCPQCQGQSYIANPISALFFQFGFSLIGIAAIMLVTVWQIPLKSLLHLPSIMGALSLWLLIRGVETWRFGIQRITKDTPYHVTTTSKLYTTIWFCLMGMVIVGMWWFK